MDSMPAGLGLGAHSFLEAEKARCREADSTNIFIKEKQIEIRENSWKEGRGRAYQAHQATCAFYGTHVIPPLRSQLAECGPCVDRLGLQAVGTKVARVRKGEEEGKGTEYSLILEADRFRK